MLGMGLAALPAWCETDFDKQITAIIREVSARNYFQAEAMTSVAQREVRLKAGAGLSRDRFRSALATAADAESITVLLRRAGEEYRAKQWEASLFSLYTANFSLARLVGQMAPAERYRRDSATAEADPSPQWLHQAARSALEAGLLSDSIRYANREIEAINRTFRGAPGGYGPSAFLSHRAYTLLGMAQLAGNDLIAAKAALANSAGVIPTGAFREAKGVGPQMALAKALLLKGQSGPVLDYLDQCSRSGWTAGSAQLATWKADILENRVPDFPRALTMY